MTLDQIRYKLDRAQFECRSIEDSLTRAIATERQDSQLIQAICADLAYAEHEAAELECRLLDVSEWAA